MRCPFKGLASFDVADAPYFFGRERLVAELVARLVGASLLGVVGPVRERQVVGRARRSAAGAARRRAAFKRRVGAAGHAPGRASAARARARDGRDGDGRVLLVVDQFEEIFTVCRDEDERRAFVAALVAPAPWRARCRARAPSRSLRALSGLPGALAAAGGASRARERDAPRRAAPRDRAPGAARGPAGRAGADGRAGGRRRARAGALPMLSTALLELWQRRDGRRLRLITYEPPAACVARSPGMPRRPSPSSTPAQQTVARSVLLRLAAEDAGGAIERRRIALAALERRRRRGRRRARGPAPAHDQRRGRGARSRGPAARVAAPARVAGRGRRGAASAPPARRRRTRLGRGGPRRRRPLPRRPPGGRAGMASPPRADLNRTERAFLDAGRGAEHAATHPPATRGRRGDGRARRDHRDLDHHRRQRHPARARRAARRRRRAASPRAPWPGSETTSRSPACWGSRPTAASRRWRPAAPCSPCCPRWPPIAGSAAHSSTEPACRTSRSARTDGRWPAPPTTGRSRCGTSPPGVGSAATQRSRRPRHGRGVQPGRNAAGQRRATMRPCGCGTWPPAGRSAARCSTTRRR